MPCNKKKLSSYVGYMYSKLERYLESSSMASIVVWLSGSKIDVEVIKKCNLSHAFFFWFLIGIALTDIDSHGLLIQLSHPQQPTPSQVALHALKHCVMKLNLCGNFKPSPNATIKMGFVVNNISFWKLWLTLAVMGYSALPSTAVNPLAHSPKCTPHSALS